MSKGLAYILAIVNLLLLACFIYNDWASDWVLNQPLYAFVFHKWFQLLIGFTSLFNFLFACFNPFGFIAFWVRFAPSRYQEALQGDLTEMLCDMKAEGMHPILISFIINWHVYTTISSIQRSRISDLLPDKKSL